MVNTLIIGGDSTIGKALHKALPDAIVTTRTELDLSRPTAWPTLPKVEVAYICAGITKLEECENNPEGSRQVNVAGTQALIEKLQGQGTHVVFLSSNQVFDGSVPFRKASDATCPINEYGRQKAAVEAWLLTRPQSASILRLTKVVDGRLPILAEWEVALRAGKIVEAFDDLMVAPLPLAGVIHALVTLGEEKKRGIFQLSGEREMSYYDMACELAVTLCVSTSRVRPISATTKGISAQFLPKHATLAPSFKS